MSTKLHDLARQAILNTGLTPRTVTASVNGSTVDLLAGDGRCFAVQQVGTVSGTSPTLAGKIQESSDNSTWSDVTNATFSAVTASNNVQTISFERTKRYLRHSRKKGRSKPRPGRPPIQASQPILRQCGRRKVLALATFACRTDARLMRRGGPKALSRQSPPGTSGGAAGSSPSTDRGVTDGLSPGQLPPGRPGLAA